MIDIIIRDCGQSGWLVIIKATDASNELYRGGRHQTARMALEKGEQIWKERGTSNIIEFKRKHGLPW